MTSRIQPVHLYIGDGWMEGGQTVASAGVYNATDARPILRNIQGGSDDTALGFVVPSPIVAGEWSLEHVLSQLIDPSASFDPLTSPAKIKVTDAAAHLSALSPGGSLRVAVDEAMALAARDPLFLEERIPLFLFDWNVAVDATIAQAFTWGVRVPGVLETVGFGLQVIPNGASGTYTSTVYQLDASNLLELVASGGATALRVTVAGVAYTSPTFVHGAAAPLYITVDWRRGEAVVSQYGTITDLGPALARVSIAGAWGNGFAQTDLTVGPLAGWVYAPSALPRRAAPRADLITIFMGSAHYDGGLSIDVDQLVSDIASMRLEPWGAGAPVLLVMPSADDTGLGTTLALRAAYDEAAARLENVALAETHHYAWSAGFLPGASIVDLAERMADDARDVSKRYFGRKRGIGWRRFATDDDANAFIEQLIEAGAETRTTAPSLGPGARLSGTYVPPPWASITTTRGPGDFSTDPNTGERLVAIDQRALSLGFTAAPGRGALLAPATTGDEDPSDASPAALSGAPVVAALTHTRASVCMIEDPRTADRFQRGDQTVAIMRGTHGNLLPNTENISWSSAPASTTEEAPDGTLTAASLVDADSGTLGFYDTDTPAGFGVADDYRISFWVKRQESPTACLGFGLTDGVSVGDYVMDLSTGERERVLSSSTFEVLRFGEWFFVSVRHGGVGFVPTALRFWPAYAPLGSGTASVTPTGSATIWKPCVFRCADVADEDGNPLSLAEVEELRRDWRTGAILLEGQRQQLIRQTEAMDVATWVTNDVDYARAVAPDGRTAANRLTAVGGGASKELSIGSPNNSTVYSLVFYLLKDEDQSRFPAFEVRQATGSNTLVLQVSTVTGEIATVVNNAGFLIDASSEVVSGKNGDEWWRVVVRMTPAVTTTHWFRVWPADGSVFGVSGIATGSITLAFPQFEAGLHPSSYIPATSTFPVRPRDDAGYATGASLGAGFLNDGFEFDVWPMHAPGSDHHTDATLVGSNAGAPEARIRLVASAPGVSLIEWSNDAAPLSVPVSWEVGQKITIRVVYAIGITPELVVSVDDVVAGVIDLTGEATWAAYSADEIQVGLFGLNESAFAWFSPFRGI